MLTACNYCESGHCESGHCEATSHYFTYITAVVQGNPYPVLADLPMTMTITKLQIVQLCSGFAVGEKNLVETIKLNSLESTEISILV